MSSGFDYGMGSAACDFDGINRYIRITDIDEISHLYNSNSPVSPQGELEEKYLVKENDILFARTGASTGKTYLYRKNDGLLYFAGFLIRANVKPNYNSYFVFSLTLTQKYRNWVKLTSMRSGQPGINSQEYASYKAYVPIIAEQQKIAAFLTLLDKRITKQRELVDYLKSYKRGVLSAIFSRKIRFKDKRGNAFPEWIQTKIGMLFSERCERAVEDDTLLAVTINSGIIKRDEIELKDNSSDDKSNYKRVYIGDIAYNTMRMWQGASGVSFYSGIVSPAYTVIHLNDYKNNNIRFWGYYFKTYKLICEFQRCSQGLTSDTWNLKYPQLANIEIYLPCYSEQTIIANFFDMIQDKIQKEENRLEVWLLKKKVLLGKMFI